MRIVVKERTGPINSNLTIGIDVNESSSLRSNEMICQQGVKLVGQGFLVDESDPLRYHPDASSVMFPFLSNKDLVHKSRCLSVIDLDGYSETEARVKVPAAYQRVYDTVRDGRLTNRDKQRRESWWLFGRSNERMRSSIRELSRFIATPEVAKHRPFVFVDGKTTPDASLYVIGVDDAFALAVLSSHIHLAWFLAQDASLEDRPRYQNGSCFEPFPFPDPEDAMKDRIRDLGEQLVAHRKRQQELHPDLTMTGMYNVLEKLRSGEALTAKERTIHEQGLVSVLKQIHDDLDAAVADAYGWPHDLSDEEILQRLVDLNHERAAEEARGIVRWLRPEFQNPAGAVPTQTQLKIAEDEVEVPAKPATAKRNKEPWPSTLPDRIRAVRTALATHHEPVAPSDLAQLFTRARAAVVEELLDTLVAVGQARQTDDGRYVA